MMYTVISVICFAIFLIAAFDILTSGMPFLKKLLWLLVVLLLPVAGPIIYLLLGRSKVLSS